MNASKTLWVLFGALWWLGAGLRVGAQEVVVKEPPTTLSTETYSLRIENVQYGRVEISLDGGLHTILIGRVQKPATQGMTEKTATLPGIVVRAQQDGVAFSTATGKVVKLLPVTLPGKPIRSGKKTIPAPGPGPNAIVTDIPRGRGPFDMLLLPPSAAPVRVISGTTREAGFPLDYVPAIDDVFVLHMQLPLPTAKNGETEAQREDALRESVRVQVTALQKEYAAGAVARARTLGHKVVSGTLTLRSALPEGEPDPITAVTYLVDGRFIAAQDTAPFVYRWNTQNVEDGEHVLEIRGVNRNNRTITRKRVLVVVQNAAAPPPPSGASTPPNPPTAP